MDVFNFQCLLDNFTFRASLERIWEHKTFHGRNRITYISIIEVYILVNECLGVLGLLAFIGDW